MKNNITEAQLLLNQEVVVTGISRFNGRRGIVTKVMADGRSLDVLVDGVGDVFLDVTLVREVRDVSTKLIDQGDPLPPPPAEINIADNPYERKRLEERRSP